jgi:hypothetical protein
MGMKAAAGKTRDEATIEVTIEVMSWLKEDFGHQGWDRLSLAESVRPGTSIIGLFRLLGDKYPTFGRRAFTEHQKDFFDYCAVILNGTFLSRLADLNRELKAGDDIKLSPGFYGG